MHVEITGDVERAIQAELSSGNFTSAEEVIAAMYEVWGRSTTGVSNLPLLEKGGELPLLSGQRRVKPFDPNDDFPDFWPPDESSEEILQFLRESRRD